MAQHRPSNMDYKHFKWQTERINHHLSKHGCQRGKYDETHQTNLQLRDCQAVNLSSERRPKWQRCVHGASEESRESLGPGGCKPEAVFADPLL